MTRVTSIEALEGLRETVKEEVALREKGEQIEQMIEICVGMATCGIAAGAREIVYYFVDEVRRLGIKGVVVTQGDCMGYCPLEPTVAVKRPDGTNIIYSQVNKARAQEILEKDVLKGESVDGKMSVF